jgi:hypothetical protein
MRGILDAGRRAPDREFLQIDLPVFHLRSLRSVAGKVASIGKCLGGSGLSEVSVEQGNDTRRCGSGQIAKHLRLKVDSSSHNEPGSRMLQGKILSHHGI